MSRYFVKISQDELKAKIEKALQSHEDFEADDEEDGGPGLHNMNCSLYLLKYLTPQIEKDLKKCEFDTENVEIAGGDFYGVKLGLQTLSNGFTFLGIVSGGDWEKPIFWIIYFDGSKLRAYIPDNGNVWNKKMKSAFGNYSEDVKAAEEQYGIEGYEGSHNLPKHDWKLIEQDILERIKEKDNLVNKIDKKISNLKTKKAKILANDWYFMENEDHEGTEYPEYFIVKKDFWNKNHYIDDCHMGSEVAMPKGFMECMESCFEYDGTKKDAVKALIYAGFEEAPQKELNNG